MVSRNGLSNLIKGGRRKTPGSNIQGSICLAPWMPTKKLAEHSRLFIVGIRRVTQVYLLNKHMINSSRIYSYGVPSSIIR
uniref:Uncharacterized protein n=1 Tax=Salix viminalis TaxID=40686 RepID=A0A6N2MDB8_SALVM